MVANKNTKRKFGTQRRGVGAIIGGVILIAILLTTVLLYYVTILQNDERKAMYDIQSSQIDQNKASERLTIASSELETNPASLPPGLYMKTLVANEGSLPSVVSHSAAYCVTCASPNNPNPSPTNSAIPLNLKESATRYVPVSVGNNYTAGFITERGNIFFSENCKIVSSTEMVCTDDSGGSTGPYFELSAVPEVLFMRPGDSGEQSIINVTSFNDFNSAVSLSVSSGTPDISVVPTTPAAVTPPPNGFDDTTVLTISASADIAEGNYLLTVSGSSSSISDSTIITIVVFDPTSGGDGDSLDDDSILKPQIQGVFPNPHGETASDSNKEGLWGTVVANPSDFDMTVRRVVITAFTPYGSNPTIFPSNGGAPYCPVTNVLPAAGGSWSCPARNTLTWSGTFVIPAHSAQEFFATVGKPSSNDDFPSYAVNFNVFTTFGQYAKAGYSGSMTKTSSEIANVYLSTTPESTSPSTMIGKLTVGSGQTLNVYATIAHLGDVGQIDAGSKVIVVIHKAFQDVVLTADPPSGFSSCSNDNLGDGSTQITCTLSAALTAGQARTVQFTMTAPTLSDPVAKLFPLLALADGTDGNPAPMGAVGPVAENVVEVTP